MRGFLMLGCAALMGTSASASDAERITIDLKYDPGSRVVSAAADVVLKPETGAKTVTFYLHDELAVSSVRIGGKAASFHQTVVPYEYSYSTKANRVVVQTAGQGLNGGLTVSYRGRFSPSAARSPSDYMRGDGEGLFLRSYAYSLWFPIFAEAHSSFAPIDFPSVRITAPQRFRAVFVGEETGREVKNGLATTTWRASAIGPYDAQLTLRPFVVKSRNGLTAYSLKDPPSEAAAERILDATGKLLAYYRSHYRKTAGERPLHLVEEPKFGDIAAANVVGLSEAEWRGMQADSDKIILLAHELVHAFVQTPTPKSDPLYVAQIEGFPSYFHLPALASVLGETWYAARLDRTEKLYLQRRETGTAGGEKLPPEKPILAIGMNEIGTYKDVFVLNDRALLFWDYLRREMAPEEFDGMVRALMTAPEVTAGSFFALIGKFAPELEDDAHLWLETSEFPERFHRTPPRQ